MSTLALALVASFLYFAVMGGILFASAGRLNLPLFWTYLLVNITMSLLGLLMLYRRTPDLIQERLHPGPGEQDRLSIPLLILILVVHWLIAGLDVGRFRWSNEMPLALQLLGLVGYILGFILFIWVMLVNRFFSSAVRLQQDRSQYLITAGPYRYVRHPGYSGAILFLLCSGLVLGAWWSILPMLIAVADIIRRTKLEDRMLQQGLAGYSEYAQKVRYRLMLGLW